MSTVRRTPKLDQALLDTLNDHLNALRDKMRAEWALRDAKLTGIRTRIEAAQDAFAEATRRSDTARREHDEACTDEAAERAYSGRRP